jgi:hypothetical protein
MSDGNTVEERRAEAGARALAEAEARRRAEKPLDLPPERGGRNGPEPVRYGDWEKNGIAYDF